MRKTDTGRAVARAAGTVVEAMEARQMLAGDGLLGTYFANQDLTAPYMTRVDPQVNMDWGSGSPDRWKSGDRWSIRWTGSIEAPRTERLTILPTTDDGVRVWINNQLVIDRWTNMAGPTETSASFDAVAGRRYDVKVEYFEGYGGAVSRLAWSSAAMPKQVIPQQYLYSVPAGQGGVLGPTEDQVAPSVPPNFTSTGKTETSVSLAWGASTDAVGVTGYEVLRGGSVIATLGSAARSYTATGLSGNTTYQFGVRAFDAAGNRSATASLGVTTNAPTPPPPPPPSGSQTPYKGVPFQVGQRIEAEDYDLGGQGVAYHDLDARNISGAYRPTEGVDISGGSNGGRGIGWTQKGEWVEYTIDVATGGAYDFEMLSANTVAGGRFHVEIDGVTVVPSTAAPNTGAWSNWQLTTVRSVQLPAGRHVMRFVVDENSTGTPYFSDVDYFRFVGTTTTPPPPQPSGIGPDLIIYNRGKDLEAVGNGVYSTNPAQQRKEQATNFNPPAFHVIVQNDGTTADSFLLKASHANLNGWFLRFIDGPEANHEIGNIITSQITGAGWRTPVLQPGQQYEIRVDVAPGAFATGDTWNNVTFTATAGSDAGKVDTVSAGTLFNGSRQVEIRRRNFDASGNYLVDVQNNGNLPSSYRILGPAGGADYTVRYFDAHFGGNDITAAVTSTNGWVTPVLAVKQSHPVRVEITSTTAGTKSITLTARGFEQSFFVDSAIIDNAPSKRGLDYFTIGVWSQPTYNFARWRDRGINTLMKYEGLSGSVSIDYWSAEANRYGLKTFRTPRANPADDRNDPALVAWMHHDEPDYNKTDPNPLLATSAQLRQIDPNRPIMINFAGSDVVDWNGSTNEATYRQYLSGTDLASSSIYPITGWGQPDHLDISSRSLDRLEKWSGGMPQMAIIEPSDQNLGHLPMDVRGPTVDEFRAQIWDNVIAGAKGIIYFPLAFTPNFTFDNTPPEIDVEMRKQNARLADLGPALMAQTDPAHFGMSADGPLKFTWREYQGKRYFIVLNMSKQAVTKTMRLHNTPATTAAVRGENRSVAVSNGTITDTFAPFEMHAYVIG